MAERVRVRRLNDAEGREHARDRTFAFDEFGPLTIKPFGGSTWSPRGRPERLRANYHKPHGSRQLFACYSIGDDPHGSAYPASSNQERLTGLGFRGARIGEPCPRDQRTIALSFTPLTGRSGNG